VHKNWAYWPADATGRFHLAPADRGDLPGTRGIHRPEGGRHQWRTLAILQGWHPAGRNFGKEGATPSIRP